MEGSDSTSVEENTASKVNEQSWFELADWSLARGIAYVITVLNTTILFLLGLLALPFQYLMVFEYHEGISDLSLIEVAGAIVIIVLLQRYNSYSKKANVKSREWFCSPFIWLGKFMLLGGVVSGLLLLGYVINDNQHIYEMNTLPPVFWKFDDYVQLYAFLCTSLSLYISIPSRDRLLKAPESEFKPEPESTAAKNNESQQQANPSHAN